MSAAALLGAALAATPGALPVVHDGDDAPTALARAVKATGLPSAQLAPTALEDLPTGHAAHALAPASPEYVFTGHATHVLALVAPATPEYVPARQLTHALALVAPATSEYVPAKQFVHALDPVTVLYLPTGQDVHITS